MIIYVSTEIENFMCPVIHESQYSLISTNNEMENELKNSNICFWQMCFTYLTQALFIKYLSPAIFISNSYICRNCDLYDLDKTQYVGETEGKYLLISVNFEMSFYLYF